MQETILIGNITQDAQIKDWNGSQFIAFSVADNETYTDSDGIKHERTTYWSCLKPVFNGNTKVAPFLTKGTLVYLRGRVSSKVYEKEGKWYGGLNLRVDDLKLLSGNRNAQNSPADGSNPSQPNNVPSQTPVAPQTANPAPQTANPTTGSPQQPEVRMNDGDSNGDLPL